MDISENSALFVYADNEPESVPARDLGGCRDTHEKPAQRVSYGYHSEGGNAHEPQVYMSRLRDASGL